VSGERKEGRKKVDKEKGRKYFPSTTSAPANPQPFSLEGQVCTKGGKGKKGEGHLWGEGRGGTTPIKASPRSLLHAVLWGEKRKGSGGMNINEGGRGEKEGKLRPN